MQRSAFLFGALMLTACETSSPPLEPAVVAGDDASSMAAVRNALARALGVARVELGPIDPARPGTFSVLPAPLTASEDRSVAMPITFRLMLEGDRCSLVRADTGMAFPLEGVACRPSTP